MNTPVIVTRALRHSYGEGELRNPILHGLDFEVKAGEITLLVGPSGSGKSTLLTLVGALRSVQEGSLQVLGQELQGASAAELMAVRRRIGFIFQSHNLVASLTVLQNVQLLLQLSEPSGQRREQRAIELLEAVGLGHRLHHYPDELSGGQRQRVAIARALAPEPELILADEPTRLPRQPVGPRCGGTAGFPLPPPPERRAAGHPRPAPSQRRGQNLADRRRQGSSMAGGSGGMSEAVFPQSWRGQWTWQGRRVAYVACRAAEAAEKQQRRSPAGGGAGAWLRGLQGALAPERGGSGGGA